MYIDKFKIFESRSLYRDKAKLEEEIKELISDIFNDLELESNKISTKIDFESSKKYLNSHIEIKFIESINRKERISISKFIKSCIDKSIEIENTNLRYMIVFNIGNDKDTYYDQNKFLSKMSSLIDIRKNRNNIERISIHLISKVKHKWMSPFRSKRQQDRRQ